jgi:hypothetical protein
MGIILQKTSVLQIISQASFQTLIQLLNTFMYPIGFLINQLLSCYKDEIYSMAWNRQSNL